MKTIVALAAPIDALAVLIGIHVLSVRPDTGEINVTRTVQAIVLGVQMADSASVVGLFIFYTPPHDSGRVLLSHVGRPCVRPYVQPSVCLKSVRIFVSGR